MSIFFAALSSLLYGLIGIPFRLITGNATFSLLNSLLP
jgi:hypothetical protein